MSTDDENKTPAEKFAELVEAETTARATPFGGVRSSQKLNPTVHEAFAIADAAVEPVERKLKWNSIFTAILAVGTIAGGVLAGQGIAKTSAREEIAPVQAETTANKERLEFFKGEFTRHLEDEHATHVEQNATNAKTNRRLDKNDEKQELILDALNVPKSKRPKREVEDP